MNPSPYAPPAAPSPADARPPSRALAVFLGIVATGLGHVYAGHTRRGLAWALVVPLAGIVWLAAVFRLHLGLWSLVMALAAVIPWIASLFDAARAAARPTARRAGVLLVVPVGIALFVFGRGSALAVRRFVLEAFNIPSGSMMPTLLIGDHVFVDKTGWTARRGDVIVFPFPEHREQDFVKRVVGMPGDRIEFDRGVPIINGSPVPRCRLGPGTIGSREDQSTGDVFVEVLDGRAHLAFYDRDAGALVEHQGPWTVPPGEVFVIGDNRLNAYDSRMWWGGKGGGVPIASVRGAVSLVWMSTAEAHREGVSFDGPVLPSSLKSLQSALDPCLAELHVK